MARYGDPLDDVAELALKAVPLHARRGKTVGVVEKGVLEARLNVFCRAYGLATETVLNGVPDYLRMVI